MKTKHALYLLLAITLTPAGMALAQQTSPTPPDIPETPIAQNFSIFVDGGASFVKDGAMLVINNSDKFKLLFDSTGTRFTTGKKLLGSVSHLPIKKVIKKGKTVSLSIINPDGKISVSVAFTRK